MPQRLAPTNGQEENGRSGAVSILLLINGVTATSTSAYLATRSIALTVVAALLGAFAVLVYMLLRKN